MTIHELLQAAGLTANDEIPIWDVDGTGEPTKKITAQQLAAAVVALANLVTGVKGNAESTYRTGNVNLTPANIGAVSKAGDTMTGPLKWDGETALPASNTLAYFLGIDAFADGGTTHYITAANLRTAIGALPSSFNTIEEHQITKIGNYFEERTAFRSRRVGGTVIILSYVPITTQVPASTQFADIGISNAEGVFTFIRTSTGASHIVTCISGKLQPDAVLPTGYYYVVGSALAPHT